VVYLVVLACVLKKTIKKGGQLFWRKKLHPSENPGYACGNESSDDVGLLIDGYPMQDVVMQWKGESMNEAVHGVEFIEIPQFTLVQHRTISTVESLTTGRSPYISVSDDAI